MAKIMKFDSETDTVAVLDNTKNVVQMSLFVTAIFSLIAVVAYITMTVGNLATQILGG